MSERFVTLPRRRPVDPSRRARRRERDELAARELPRRLVGRPRRVKTLEGELHKILRQDDHPMTGHIKLHGRLEEAVTQHSGNFFVSPNTTEIGAESENEAKKLVDQYKKFWRDQIPPALAAA